jgi:CRISPR type III-B/RAMP module RAMP protein Cmr6
VQSDSFRYSVNNEYEHLDAECGLNIQNFRPNNSPARRNGTKANLRLAYYSYLETANGYQSWFDQYGLVTVNQNIGRNLGAYGRIFGVQVSKLPIPKGSVYDSFELKVGSRGLLVGTGYPHMNLMKEDNKSDFQLGFFFDHSTGFPLIPASSVKGFLRAGFPATDEDDIALKQLIEEMGEAGITVPASFDYRQAREMENALFGDMSKPARGSLFFNAYITKSTNPNVNNNQGNGRPYLDEDWLAPHLYNGKRSRLREPNPIRFLKIVPGVVFQFSFLADSTTLSGGLTITPQQKIELYKILLTNRNLGAKHRSGFGSFWEV